MRWLSLIIVSLSVPMTLWASGVNVQQVHLVDQDRVQIQLSWSHGWHIPSKDLHDAVWLFIKYKDKNGDWKHQPLSTNPNTSFKISGNATIEVSSDGKGCWVRSADTGTAIDLSANIELKLSSGLSADITGLTVIGLEMAYVGTSSFDIGDGQSIGHLHKGDDSLQTFQVQSEAAISVGQNSADLFATQDPPKATIPASYPKGYEGFYAMKYELSQELYATFLNTLNFNQQSNRMAVSPSASPGTTVMGAAINASRNGLVILQSGEENGKAAVIALNGNINATANQYEDARDRACNRIKWADLCAFLDWACLRPMTELEFEKSCRGPLTAIPGELSFGMNSATDAETVLEDGSPEEQVLEVASAGTGIANYGNFNPNGLGALRNGFAATTNSSRTESGASYYGLMEMSGNLWEQVINLKSEALIFNGDPGDGELDVNGDADLAEWCPQSGDCAGHKGGAYQSTIWDNFNDLAVSDRYYINLNPQLLRRNTVGGRGVRKP